MTDKELLELAAKAAGLNLDWDSYTAMNLHRPMASLGDTNWFQWNPLTDDGDALRLAVKLEQFMTVAGNGKTVVISATGRAFEEINRFDPYAATRRAIVRAAAQCVSQK